MSKDQALRGFVLKQGIPSSNRNVLPEQAGDNSCKYFPLNPTFKP